MLAPSLNRIWRLCGPTLLWVLDQRGDRLVLHREPTPRGYAAVRALLRDESIAPLAFSQNTFTVAEILG